MEATIINLYDPLPWQLPALRDKSPVMLLTGSAGGGKSKAAGEKIHAFCKKYTNAMGVMLRKTRNSMTNSTVLFMDRNVIGQDPDVTHRPSKNRFEYTNGSILAYGGMANEEQREQIRSIGQDGAVDILWMEEATKFTEEDYNEATARMRGKAAPWNQIMLTTNPDRPTHWIYLDLIKGGGASVHYSSAVDNPHNPPSYRENLARLKGVLAQRLREGKWIQAEGVIYSNWRDDVHFIDNRPIPDDWRRFRVVDFGYTNPFVCQWWAVDGDDRLYLYREIYYTERTVKTHAAQITVLSKGERIEATICDHDAEDRATLRENGIPNIAAKKAVNTGIDKVIQRLALRGDERPGVYIMRGALVETDPTLESAKRPLCTQDELAGYVWANHKTKEMPVKENDHGMDAMRYMVMHLDGGMQGWARG